MFFLVRFRRSYRPVSCDCLSGSRRLIDRKILTKKINRSHEPLVSTAHLARWRWSLHISLVCGVTTGSRYQQLPAAMSKNHGHAGNSVNWNVTRQENIGHRVPGTPHTSRVGTPSCPPAIPDTTEPDGASCAGHRDSGIQTDHLLSHVI